jgi:hypothetical protein
MLHPIILLTTPFFNYFYFSHHSHSINYNSTVLYPAINLINYQINPPKLLNSAQKHLKQLNANKLTISKIRDITGRDANIIWDVYFYLDI